MAALSACADAIGPDPADDALRLERIGPEVLEGAPGFPLSDSIRVQVVDPAGSPMPDAPVVFRVVSGGGTVDPGVVRSGAQGTAAATWILGPAAGEQRLEVSIEGESAQPLVYTASATYSNATSITAVSGSSTVMPVGCPVPDPLTVRVTDSSGAPVAGADVLFVTQGGDPADGVVAETDAQGLARLAWRVRSSSETVIARVAAPGDPQVSFEVSGIPVAPGGFATIGNQIYGPECEPMRFYGVARPGLQWWPSDSRLADASLSTAEFEAMRSWGANVVRIPLYQRYWLRDFTSQGVTYTKEEYRALIRALVDRATAKGLAVILDLHNSDRGDPDFPDDVADIQQMADVAHSIPFWQQVAAAYGDDGQVIFQLYTEPNQIGWDLWRNGGMVPAGDTHPPQSSGVAFEAAGMQDLYDAVRGAGADNLVIVNGLHWGYDLSRIPEYALDGYNIVYATHPYDYADKQPPVWWRDWGFVSETYPVMVAEFGDYTCNRDGYYTSLLDFADQHGISWVAWAWWAPPADRPELVCEFPALLEGWPGTPSPTGSLVRARMQSYGK